MKLKTLLVPGSVSILLNWYPSVIGSTQFVVLWWVCKGRSGKGTLWPRVVHSWAGAAINASLHSGIFRSIVVFSQTLLHFSHCSFRLPFQRYTTKRGVGVTGGSFRRGGWCLGQGQGRFVAQSEDGVSQIEDREWWGGGDVVCDENGIAVAAF